MAMIPKQKTQLTDGKQKQVVSCNFRSAGRISNEHVRALTSIHENFAGTLTAALDAFLGTAVTVELNSLDQMLLEEHMAGIPAFSGIVPFAMRSAPGAILVECEIELLFCIIDLLFGGVGNPGHGPRDLSEIEEEILLDVFSLLVRNAETAWRLSGGTLVPGKCVKPAMLDQYCSPGEKLTCVNFMLTIGGSTGSLQLVLSSAFLNLILQQIRLDRPQKRAAIRNFPRQGIRDRILDSDVEVAVELSGLRITVKDLLGLLPGSVLKLRTSVRTPGMLVAGGHGIFEATPVRNGQRKAAQLGRRIAPANLEGV